MKQLGSAGVPPAIRRQAARAPGERGGGIAKGRVAIALVLAAGAVAGCATQDPDTMERDFGNSVRRMVEAQKYVPPSAPAGPVTMDGVRAEEVLKVYRADVAKPKDVKQPVNISIGAGG